MRGERQRVRANPGEFQRLYMYSFPHQIQIGTTQRMEERLKRLLVLFYCRQRRSAMFLYHAAAAAAHNLHAWPLPITDDGLE